MREQGGSLGHQSLQVVGVLFHPLQEVVQYVCLLASAETLDLTFVFREGNKAEGDPVSLFDEPEWDTLSVRLGMYILYEETRWTFEASKWCRDSPNLILITTSQRWENRKD